MSDITAPLSSSDKEIWTFVRIAIAANTVSSAPTGDDLAEFMDMGDGGPAIATTVLVIQRLERAGLIQVRRYQRSRQIVLGNGMATAQIGARTPHWRKRVSDTGKASIVR